MQKFGKRKTIKVAWVNYNMNLARDYNGYARKRYHFHVHDCRKKGKVVKTENS
jgi:hypothetical protein